MNDTEREADALNEALDTISISGANADALPFGFDALLLADAATPGPEDSFAQMLRVRLVRQGSKREFSNPLGTQFGIVAVRPESLQVRRMGTPLAIAAALLLAFFAFNAGWPDVGRQAFGVPTAHASATSVAVTPTPTATMPVLFKDDESQFQSEKCDARTGSPECRER